MISKEVRIRELTILAEKLKVEHYSEYEMIREMIEVRPADWKNNWLTDWMFRTNNIIYFSWTVNFIFGSPFYYLTDIITHWVTNCELSAWPVECLLTDYKKDNNYYNYFTDFIMSFIFTPNCGISL